MVPGVKPAVTEFVAVLKVKLHAPVPVQAPVHPEKAFGAVALSLSDTEVPGGKVAEQPVVDPLVQLIPAGLLVTVPVPVPDVLTVTVSPGVNVAVTFSAAVTVTLQLVVPEHAPLQPPK